MGIRASALGVFKFLASYLKGAHRWKGGSFISTDSAGNSAGDATRKQQARQTRDQGRWLLFTVPFHGVQNEGVLIPKACNLGGSLLTNSLGSWVM